MTVRTSTTLAFICCASLGWTLGCQAAKERVELEEASPPSPESAPASAIDAKVVLATAEQRLLAEAIARARRVGLSRPGPAAAGETSQSFEEPLARLLLAGPGARTWATFGLGRGCAAHAGAVEPLLTATSAVWFSSAVPPSEDELRVLGNALGSCQTRSAEATLAGWLAPPPAADADGLIRAAAAGLGTLADLSGTLRENSQTALLDAAAARKDAFLLYPLSRLRNLPEAVSERLLEVAGSILVSEKPGPRVFAILALGGASADLSAPALVQILLSNGFSATERSAAAHALARLGEAGQKALDEVASALLARGLPSQASDPLWSPLRATLDALENPERSLGELRKLSALPVAEHGDGPAAALRRRMIWLRCRAADLLARDRTQSATLAKCDPENGPTFELAMVRVLARSRIELGRRKAWEERLASSHPLVVEAALRLIAGHAELGDVREPLAHALGANAPGTRATAAKILAAYPARAHDPKRPEGGPDPRIVTALGTILQASGDRVPEETVAAALGAAAALSTLALKPLIEGHCRGPRPALRDAAERALAILGTPGQRCPAPSSKEEPIPSPVRLEPDSRIEFQSDVGPLVLVLNRAGTGRARAFIEQRLRDGDLTRSPIHATSPGLSVLLGDPDGDGFEGDLPALEAPLELGPWDFEAGSVALSSFAPGAFGSQLLIALEPLPALVGRRVLLGRAEGPWHLLWPGDRIESAPGPK